ncbi:hypothetical protein GWI33_017787 [Rhynchophorus ferrugineus]|uniref:Uncharacterized protein n=1 Tax=Rhynchophorus ferrugineus TaxID=354439 RepID=A0A834HZ22_RHYFE|nr:hypothetical protein GWI33_017787 [Rhynchophorus ferrugineus]
MEQWRIKCYDIGDRALSNKGLGGILAAFGLSGICNGSASVIRALILYINLHSTHDDDIFSNVQVEKLKDMAKGYSTGLTQETTGVYV